MVNASTDSKASQYASNQHDEWDCSEELEQFLSLINRDDWVVLETLKESPHEITQLVTHGSVSALAANRLDNSASKADIALQSGESLNCADNSVAESGAQTPYYGVPRYIRKIISMQTAGHVVYDDLHEAYMRGEHFMHIPSVYECNRVALPEEHAAGEICEIKPGSTGETLEVIMQYVPGITLASYIEQQGASMQLAMRCMPLLCDAVMELHEAFNPPLIHRDIKPSNIMVSGCEGTSSLNLYLIDFGIARRYNEGQTVDTTCFGTRSFAPPEQFGFGQTDVRSDVYALGMVLYYCITGLTITDGNRMQAFTNTAIPQPLQTVLIKATEFDPQLRYQSVAEFKRACLYAFKEPEQPKQSKQPQPQSQSQPQPQPQPQSQSQSRKALFSARKWAGRIWNVCLFVVWAAMMLICAWAVVFPSESDALLPTWFLFYEYIGFMAVSTTVMLVPFVDKTRIKQRIPWLQRHSIGRFSFVKQLAICVGITAIMLVILIVVGGYVVGV